MLADPQGSESSFLASPGTLAGRYANPPILSCDHFIGLYANSRDILLAQDLKDFGREAGNVSFADIDRDVPGQGYVTFIRRYVSC